jgi:hypothetical protein
MYLRGPLVLGVEQGVRRGRLPHPRQSTLRRSAGSCNAPCAWGTGCFVFGSFAHYDEGVKQIPCVCGYAVKGEDDDELWQNAQKHLREDHPDLVGKVSRADLLAQAEEVPKPTS